MAVHPIIDGDGHVMEPTELWAERMDRRRWGDWVPRRDPATEKIFVGGEYRAGGARKAVAEQEADHVAMGPKHSRRGPWRATVA